MACHYIAAADRLSTAEHNLRQHLDLLRDTCNSYSSDGCTPQFREKLENYLTAFYETELVYSNFAQDRAESVSKCWKRVIALRAVMKGLFEVMLDRVVLD